jgi:hypothetical protein
LTQPDAERRESSGGILPLIVKTIRGWKPRMFGMIDGFGIFWV